MSGKFFCCSTEKFNPQRTIIIASASIKARCAGDQGRKLLGSQWLPSSHLEGTVVRRHSAKISQLENLPGFCSPIRRTYPNQDTINLAEFFQMMWPCVTRVNLDKDYVHVAPGYNFDLGIQMRLDGIDNQVREFLRRRGRPPRPLHSWFDPQLQRPRCRPPYLRTLPRSAKFHRERTSLSWNSSVLPSFRFK
jgi:hypothetical protein